ncbi:MAG TPA: hypothetical protein IGS52_11990 [Oscillatoriaceae cyanobacterium M33_DOE_052]|uniref:Uncharacterized protein n=1 Tax=Planktothricoides sp. SpSt-374 TaxID=2282167 RepID=A0A7C3VRI8_9CYAN|nr:hypothetical protein [Oscillatoriaceae cyanobacterium M33_DOE_052]
MWEVWGVWEVWEVWEVRSAIFPPSPLHPCTPAPLHPCSLSPLLITYSWNASPLTPTSNQLL